jgi:dTDP-4-dehydrorhamnose 3,5-epimerase
MTLIETKLPGVFILAPKVFGDERGFFLESYRANTFRDIGINDEFVQDNHSRSRCGVLRGLHYQLERPQGKLVRVTKGSVFDVTVDIRRNSPTFGQWIGCILDDIDHRQLYISPGFAHGFCVLSEQADFVYKCTEYYDPATEYGIAWNDPDIGIKWPLNDIVLSSKDANNPRLRDQPNIPVLRS